MELVNMFDPVIKAAEASNTPAPGDYEIGGILHCGRCRTAKQTVKMLGGKERKVDCLCRCANEAYEKEKKAAQKQEEFDKVFSTRKTGISSQRHQGWTFETDDGSNKETIDKMRRYAEAMASEDPPQSGLLLYGPVGTGKSFCAACVCNYLYKHGVPAAMVNLPTVLNALSDIKTDKNQYLSDLMKYPLLVLDDFGVERQTDFALEQVFNVIDERYRCGKPLIITTNIPLEDFRNPKDLNHKRIYDRILEICSPILVAGASRREQKAVQNLKATRELLCP
jgi:DNA replication protein DnaC